MIERWAIGSLAAMAALAACQDGSIYVGSFLVGGGGTTCAPGSSAACAGSTGGVGGQAPATPGELLWAKRFGDEIGNQGARRVAADPMGNVLIAGGFSGSMDFGGGPLQSAGLDDVFVAKLDPFGNHLWSRRFGDAHGQTCTGLAVRPSGSVVVAGDFAGSVSFGGGPLTSAGSLDAFVAELDAAGHHVWSRRFGGSGLEHVAQVAVDTAGDVVLAGYFTESIDFGNGPLTSAGGRDVFVVKLAPTGAHLWSRSFGGPGDEIVMGVAADQGGNVLLTGYFDSTIDFGGGNLVSAGMDDVFVAKLDGSGGHVWSRRFGDPGDQIARDLVSDTAGNVILAGYFDGAVDFGGGSLSSEGATDAFVAKLDANGAHLWNRRFGDAGKVDPMAVAVDGTGNVLLAGYFTGSVDFGGGPLACSGSPDAFLAKLDASGGHLWSKGIGGGGSQSADSVTVDAQGRVLLAGSFQGSMPFGGSTLTSAGAWDAFVAKLEQ